jgi:prepilin-type N-terminal cleavage/methylation domain-containing protein
MSSSIGSPAECRLKRASEAGFTLIECLVAGAIAAVLLVALLQGFTAGIRSGGRSEAWSGAAVIAQSTIAELAAADPMTETTFERDEGRYNVAASVQRYPGPDRAGVVLMPYEISVTVSFRDGAQSRALELRSLRLGKPETADDQ